MKAIGYKNVGTPDVLEDIELPVPKATGYDLLVEVKAIAVNPIDCKARAYLVNPENNSYKIPGWDAAGVVKAVGDKVSLFKPGDEVWYAGSLNRQGCNSEYHLVDERIVGFKPKTLSYSQAAALPLTTLTAWELLFDRLTINEKEQATLLITGAAGGVGSILTQLARQLTSLTIIGTASRTQSQAWVKSNGAHHVINHNQPLKAQLNELGFSDVDYVISLTHTDEHGSQLIDCLKPQGKFALIDDPEHFDFRAFKLKSISIHWELMFTRSMFMTSDLIKQHDILNETAKLVDSGLIKTTLNEEFGSINALNLKRAHQLIESGKSVGKIVLEGFNH
ncbi:NADPH-quinone reductase and Zn-dependent oxidoreductase [Legionella beliardensis]|uniref:Zinc-type alcohol dehydrogenase-like protein n=2 Tax=Legionella beliardensis TaxID=91822 RepID=A0A378I1N9_9GAMM|nr:NADPH-quinone reductase and Zn-dependent oxidoreductase [Legionella beliardensis]